MDSSKIPTREELYGLIASRLQKRYAEIPSAPYPMRVQKGTWFDEMNAALYASDESTATEHFRKSARAAKAVFDFIWENRGDWEFLLKEVGGPPSSSSTVLEYIHAAFAGKEFEIAKQIAEKSDLPWHKKWSHGQAHRYAIALRRLLLEGSYSGFKEIKPEKGLLTFGYLGEIWRTAENDPRQALLMTDSLAQKANAYSGMFHQIWQISVIAIRNWIALRHPEIEQ